MFLKKLYIYCILTLVTATVLSACSPRKGILPRNNESAIIESKIAQ